MKRISILAVAAVLLSLAAQGTAQQIVDATTGNPLVDGPGPYKRLLPRNLDRSRPLVIGHRGDSGEFPEHSELAYRAAINHGAQFIECCDIVLTADLVPVCRHEPVISNTTNADQLFPDRIKTYVIDNTTVTGVHTVDLTLAELKQVRVRERTFERSQAYNDFLPVMTFEECATMARDFYTREGIVVGIYPETKHPTWHDSIIAERWPEILRLYKDTIASPAGQWAAIQGPRNAGNSRNDDLPEGEGRGRGKGRDKEKEKEKEDRNKGLPPPPTMTDIVLEVAHRLGYNNDITTPEWSRQPIFLQSFEVNNLRYARRRTRMPITQLTSGPSVPLPDESYPTYGALLANMSGIASYAQGLGPSKGTLLSNYNKATGGFKTGSGDPIVNAARAAGLQVHLYTLRNEPPTWNSNFNSIDAEYTYYFKTLGVEGGFTDFPGTLVPWTKAKGPWPRGNGNRWLQ